MLDLAGMALLTFVLGMRHGMDADHLATIDGFARGHAQRHPRLARCSGLLFSLGHGGVVIGVATAAALMSGAWALPAWLETSGALVSVVFLLLLGSLNLRQVVCTPAGQKLRPAGLKSRWMSPVFAGGAATPLLIVITGALFAFSLDTLSQALFFSVAGKGGAWIAAMLGILFTLGMMASDALNGLWTAWMMRRADRAAASASRMMGLMVSLLSLGVAAFGIGRLESPTFAARIDDGGLWIGAGVLLFMLASYLTAMWVAAGERSHA